MFARRRRKHRGLSGTQPDCKPVTFHKKNGEPKTVVLCKSHKGARKRAAKKLYAKNGLPWENKKGRKHAAETFYQDIDRSDDMPYAFAEPAHEPRPWQVREGYEGARSRRRARRR